MSCGLCVHVLLPVPIRSVLLQDSGHIWVWSVFISICAATPTKWRPGHHHYFTASQQSYIVQQEIRVHNNVCCLMVPGTFGVIGISANISSPTGLVCLFNPGSLATGCLVYLIDTATGVTYCRVDGRSLDTPVNISFCPFSPSNVPLGTGVYSVVVYVIESDGSVSSVPAITGEVLDVIGPSTISPGIIFVFFTITQMCNSSETCFSLGPLLIQLGTWKGVMLAAS